MPIYNVSPGRKDAEVLAIVRGERGNEGRLMYWPLIHAADQDRVRRTDARRPSCELSELWSYEAKPTATVALRPSKRR